MRFGVATHLGFHPLERQVPGHAGDQASVFQTCDLGSAGERRRDLRRPRADPSRDHIVANAREGGRSGEPRGLLAERPRLEHAEPLPIRVGEPRAARRGGVDHHRARDGHSRRIGAKHQPVSRLRHQRLLQPELRETGGSRRERVPFDPPRARERLARAQWTRTRAPWEGAIGACQVGDAARRGERPLGSGRRGQSRRASPRADSVKRDPRCAARDRGFHLHVVHSTRVPVRALRGRIWSCRRGSSRPVRPVPLSRSPLDGEDAVDTKPLAANPPRAAGRGPGGPKRAVERGEKLRTPSPFTAET